METAEKVDLAEVRVKKKPRLDEVEVGSDGYEVELEAGEAEELPVERKVEEELEPVASEESASAAAETQPVEVMPATPEPVAPPIEAAPPAPPVAAQAPEATVPKAEEKPPEPPRPVVKAREPIVVVPAGPMLEKPRPAKLSGPQVVRVEAPEPLDRPRSRFKPRYDAPVTQPLMYRNKDATGSARVPGSSMRRTRRAPSRDPPRTARMVVAKKRRKTRPSGASSTRTGGSAISKNGQARLTAAGGEGLRLRPTRRIASKGAKDSGSVPARPKKVVLSEPILVKDLSAALAVKVADIIGKLMQQGVMATANQSISNEVAELIAVEFDTELVVERKATLEEEIQKEFEQRERAHLKRRPIVAAMLGHVDHGKTSLLDRIRKTHVAAGEAGGITQHMGAYQVSWDNKTVAFLDTPGHEAFTAMRARGANMTDIVVLVVAADDGVMPQTIEAIAHSKAAGVAIVVALNKIDLPGIDLNRIYAQLSEHGLTPTEWGGQTEVVKTSATTGQGVDDLLEALDYVAELLELKADDTIPATGWVVEARMSTQEGPVATVLIKEGRLEKGDVLLAASPTDAFGR